MDGLKTARRLCLGVITAFLGGCAVLAPLPEPSTVSERLAMLPAEGAPVAGRTTIHWDRHQIPFVEAETDADAAVALGLVHAHLRLGQMEILRRISQGRLAEMGGPLATEIDQGIRLLDFDRAVPEIEAQLPDDTRLWLDGFVRGVNHYQHNVERLPLEFAVLGLEREPWTVADVLTIGRLVGTDVNWLVWFNILKLRTREDWPQLWARLVENGSESTPSFEAAREQALLGEILSGVGRSGSNSFAVAPSKTLSGGAIIANDPHLGIYAPNTWLLAGVKSPSYHAVGMMAPGLPLFAIGRNPWVAWGGTNMRAASSELYDVSDLAPGEIRERTEDIAVRWWFDESVKVRETPWGPILSDAPQFEALEGPDFALRWAGHLASDETTAFLKASQARNVEAFRAAFTSFSTPGQNMLAADSAGNIAQIMAVQLPRRNGAPPADVILRPEAREGAWEDLVGVLDLPYSLNPERGYIASANNRPTNGKTQVGYFFSPDDRVERISELLTDRKDVDLAAVREIQQDVYMASSVALRDTLVGEIDALGIAARLGDPERAVLALIRTWDGYYDRESRGAVAFELLRDAFTAQFYEISFGEQDWAAFANVGRIKSLLREDIERAEPEALSRSLVAALQASAERIGDFDSWGDMHRLELSHPLSAIPVIGGKFRFADLPVGGSSDSLMKTAHATTSERHATRYGANARHVSDLSDMDLNWFVLLGGQDGWLNSTTFLDQLPLWTEGDYIQLPLRLEAVRARTRHTTELEP